MKKHHLKPLLLAASLLTLLATECAAQYSGWQHSGSIFILTTPEGADLPASAVEKDFPLLVRLHKDFFDFSQAKADGADVRFSTSAGEPLAYQIEEWDLVRGNASIWVRIPTIKGNARQEFKLHWGKADAAGESNGSSVFNAANGYATVMHLGEKLTDEVGTITPRDAGSTVTGGVIGKGRQVTQGKGINGGDHITNYPYSDMPFTSELWLRADNAGAAVFGWGRYATRFNGKTGDGNEVVISFGAPPSLGWGSDGPGGANGRTTPVLGQWYHVAATYANGTNQIYVNGQLDGSRYHRAAMSITTNIQMTVGGLRGSYQFAGDIDEVRVSRVARSADWLRLEYENQKPQQTLVGTLVPPGDAFSVSPAVIKLAEGRRVTATAQAGGAQKVYWIIKRDGGETLAAVDRFVYPLDAGRVVSNVAYVLQFKAVYANEVKTKDIPVTIVEDIPEPVFTLNAPAKWNGRDTIEVVPAVRNLAAMRAKDAGTLAYKWTVAGGAVIKEVAPDRLILKRSQYTGPLTVQLALNNGGADVTAATPMMLTEPKRDPWVQRTPSQNEQPEDNQFYARDDRNEGTLFYNGTLPTAADSVFLRVYAEDKLVKTETARPAADKSYALTAKLKPGLVKYKVEFGTQAGGTATVVQTVSNLVCGDAYLIDGQSNAEATGPNNGTPPESEYFTSEWIRSYGNLHAGTSKGGWGKAVRTHKWGTPQYGDNQIGTWGMVLASNLLAQYSMPICIINGAVGGTRIDQHQRNDSNPNDQKTIYGRLLTRVAGAQLTHGIRGVLWHQGENNSGSASPTGDYDYKSYQQYFVDMAADWKTDYPNIRYYYVYQVWPLPCAMGPKDDQLREVQRTLPRVFSNLRVMSTIGAAGAHGGRGSCHFDLEGYAMFANFLSPLVEVDNYGLRPKQEVTAPDLKRAWFTTSTRDEIALDFGQPMTWKDAMKKEIHLDEARAQISTGTADGNMIRLQLTAPTTAKTIGYVFGRDWDGKPDSLLFGANGIAALTFCNVPIQFGNASR